MRGDHEPVGPVGAAGEGASQQAPAAEVERHGLRRGDDGRDVRVLDHVEDDPGGLDDDLARLARLDQVPGAQRLVPALDVVQRATDRGRVEAALVAQDERHHPLGAAGDERVQEPQPLLAR